MTERVHRRRFVAPLGQRTTLALDANGYLAAVTNPANEAVTLGYTADRGRLESAQDPRGELQTEIDSYLDKRAGKRTMMGISPSGSIRLTGGTKAEVATTV